MCKIEEMLEEASPMDEEELRVALEMIIDHADPEIPRETLTRILAETLNNYDWEK
jgi:hypothetical protein